MKKLEILLIVLILLFGCSKENQRESINLVGCWNVENNTGNEKYYFSFSKDTVRYCTSIKSGDCKYELFGDKLMIHDWCCFDIIHVKNHECVCLNNDDLCINLCKNYINHLE